jgi:hypothetical protein
MEGRTIGIFGTDQALKTSFEDSIAKKSEVEGIIVYHRAESGTRFSFLDDAQFPDKIQGYSRIASLSDQAFYLYPKSGTLTPPDGELAVLLDSFKLRGAVELIDCGFADDAIASAFKGTSLAQYRVERRSGGSSVVDLSAVEVSPSMPRSGLLVYIDRAFSVKGVGVVVLGFVLSGQVSVHDKLRLIPSSGEKVAEVKGVQVNDVDQEAAGRGIRVGLSLRGVELKDLEKTSWLDDGSFRLTTSLDFDLQKSPFYRQPLDGRTLHLQLPGEAVVSSLKSGQGTRCSAELASQAPVWEGMRVCVLDLNAKGLRVAGGGSCV